MLPRVRGLVFKHFQVPDHVAGRDDLVQIGMLGVIKAAERWRPDGGASFPGYATTRAFGAIQDHLRSQAFGGRCHYKEFSVCSLDSPVRVGVGDGDTVPLGHTIPSYDTPSDPLILDAISDAVRGCSLDVRSAFALAFEDDLSLVEIGEMMGVSESRVHQLLDVARAAIAAHPVVAPELAAA